ncbi:MAG: phytanoyl-CoA dioxygenase [Actinomycetia bacterium]|nr:phytanoyl-CoA dioxygenase [Actinomycetes bacterium]
MTDFTSDGCDLDEFRRIVETESELSDYPHSAGSAEGAIVYDAGSFEGLCDSEVRPLKQELARALRDGPGIVVLKGAFAGPALDAASAVFDELIARQRDEGMAGGDHFAAPGANDRIWNSLEKLALADPDVFVDYHDNVAVDLVALAWLGPAYQVTAQVNVVNPGGAAQSAHRDYHLGFLSNAQSEQYPRHVHLLSPALTLQGAVAHCDMPVETGPTMYLPHSQKYEAGYLAWRRDDFREYFDTHRSQSPLAKGDLVFFNPALFHGAGANETTDIRRMANLLQISSALGRAMELIDRRAMTEAVYPALLRARQAGRSEAGLLRAVAACAEGYPFPADLDRDQPVGGMAPASMASIVATALDESLGSAELSARFDARFGSR